MRRQLRVFLTLIATALLTAVSINPPAANAVPLNPLNAWRFGATNICLDNPLVNNLPSGTAAMQWGYAADIDVVHDYGYNGCDDHSEATTIDILYDDLGPNVCVHPSITWNGATGLVTNANIWFNYNPAVKESCFGTYKLRAHYMAQAVGYALGLDTHHNGNRSVMSDTAWSIENVYVPEDSDYDAIERRYPW